MTVPQIINIARISEYLASTSILKSGLFGGGTPNYLPKLIYCVRKNVERMYSLDPDDENLVGNANYLFTLCSRFNREAQHISGVSGTVASITPANAPQRQTFKVDVDTFMVTGQSTITMPSTWLNYGVIFWRNHVPQSPADVGDGSSFYTWNPTTRVFVITPAAIETEDFDIIPYAV